MELLYVWIDKCENEIYNKVGVSLNDKYKISVKKDKDKYIVKIEEKNAYFNIFKNETITNVTAIVGANGTGKTTLLKNIFLKEFFIEYKTEDEVWEVTGPKAYENSKMLEVFEYSFKDNQDKEEKKELIIIHNLSLEVESNKEVKIFKQDFQKINATEEKIRNYKNKITKLFVTNTYYINEISNPYPLEAQGYNAIMSPLEFNSYARKFYLRCRKDQEKGKINPKSLLDDMIEYSKLERNFQSICDLLYLKKLNDEEHNATFEVSIPEKITIINNSIIGIYECVKSIYKTGNTILKVKKWCNIKKSINKEGNFVSSMWLNMLFEFDIIYDILDDNLGDNKLVDINSVKDIIKKFVEQIENKNEKIYYQNGIEEITDLEKILNCYYKRRNVPGKEIILGKTVNDINEYYYISRCECFEQYKAFLEFIEKISMSRKSFVLKYLKIEGFKLSSGERAYLNIFSWINLLSKFSILTDKYTIQKVEAFKDNIILLIDEIELYCHPEWQRKFLKCLLSDLKKEFNGKKVQIIFSTHSPIILSDMPSSNIVYLKGIEKNKVQVDNRKYHKDTFGANIFKLYNDAFFLSDKGAIGEFAKDKINNLYKELKEEIENGCTDNSKKDEREFIINSIGEPIIKNKLSKMFKERYNDREQYIIEKQKRIIEELRKEVSGDSLKELRKKFIETIKVIDDKIYAGGSKND